MIAPSAADRIGHESLRLAPSSFGARRAPSSAAASLPQDRVSPQVDLGRIVTYVQKHPRLVAVLLHSVVRMNDRADPEALFLEHLGWIDRVASIACRNQAIRGADAEEFIASLRMKLMEDDYAILRHFRGEGELKTYLASVVIRHLRDYTREQRGRWRHSAAAERLGPPAMDLEALVRREGYTLAQAGERLRTAGRTTLSDVELARLLAQLPDRGPLRPVEIGPPPGEIASDASHTDDQVIAAEAGTRRREVLGALTAAMEDLEPEEQLIVRMHFADGYTLGDVARALHLEQKPLYRRVERLRTRLRVRLESAGLRSEDVQNLLYEFDAP